MSSRNNITSLVWLVLGIGFGGLGLAWWTGKAYWLIGPAASLIFFAAK